MGQLAAVFISSPRCSLVSGPGRSSVTSIRSIIPSLVRHCAQSCAWMRECVFGSQKSRKWIRSFSPGLKLRRCHRSFRKAGRRLAVERKQENLTGTTSNDTEGQEQKRFLNSSIPDLANPRKPAFAIEFTANTAVTTTLCVLHALYGCSCECCPKLTLTSAAI